MCCMQQVLVRDQSSATFHGVIRPLLRKNWAVLGKALCSPVANVDLFPTCSPVIHGCAVSPMLCVLHCSARVQLPVWPGACGNIHSHHRYECSHQVNGCTELIPNQGSCQASCGHGQPLDAVIPTCQYTVNVATDAACVHSPASMAAATGGPASRWPGAGPAP
jgi:hypothetical protein